MSANNKDFDLGPGATAEKRNSFMSMMMKANKNIEEAKRVLKYEDLSRFVDQDKLKMENLDNLNQIETYALLQKYPLPSKKLWLMAGITAGYFGLVTYMAIKKGPAYFGRITKDKNKSLGTMLATGTVVTGKLFLGYGAIMLPFMWSTGVMQDIQNNSKINFKLGNSIVINDDEIQEYLLVNTLKYFEISDSTTESVRKELETRRTKMDQKKETLTSIVSLLEDSGELKIKPSKSHSRVNDDDDL